MNNPAPGFARNPDKIITVAPHRGEVFVMSAGRAIARSTRALDLKEGDYPVVVYVPFADIDFAALERSARTTHCPFKGDATYWSVRGGAEDAMWAYEAPYDEMVQIRDHGAFYPDRVILRG